MAGWKSQFQLPMDCSNRQAAIMTAQDGHAPGAGRSLLLALRLTSSAAGGAASACAVAPLLLLEVLAASAGEDEGMTVATGDRADAAARPWTAAVTAIAGSVPDAGAGELVSESHDLLLESLEPLAPGTGRRSDAHAVSTCITQAVTIGRRIAVQRGSDPQHRVAEADKGG